jgi:hypothetical protein
MQKLRDCGREINRKTQLVYQTWNDLCLINGKRPGAVNLYRSYMHDIVHNEDEERKLHDLHNLIIRGRNELMKNNLLEVNIDQDNNDEFEEYPTVVASAESDRIGIITNVNLSLANFLGYNKTEIINRKLNSLMSDMFSENHD